MDMTRFEERVAQMREKAGFEHIGKFECSTCGNEYDLFKRKNTEKPIYNCPYCAVEAEDAAYVEKVIKQRSKEKQMRANRLNEVPIDIREKTFDDYQPKTQLQQQAKQTSIDFANDNIEEASMVFQGDTGIGKSHLSMCVAREFEKRQKTYVFIDVPELMNKIKTSYDPKKSTMSQEEIMSIIKYADLLVLDDIGAEYVKPDANGHESWAADIIFQIVNSRLGKQNIYTTNYTSKDLKRKYGMLSSRIISRMMNKAKVIKVDGDDHRLKGFE